VRYSVDNVWAEKSVIRRPATVLTRAHPDGRESNASGVGYTLLYLHVSQPMILTC
jgi:hypothetical protein